MPDIISGLTCPNCSGTLSVREGQRIIKCPYCDARSLIKGESGLARYQVARKISQEQAAQAVRSFWSGLNKAMDLPAQAKLSELFLTYLPYWRAQAQVAGWVFGEKKYQTKNSTRYEPREKQIMEEMEWSGAAGDVAEFGVKSINLRGAQFAAYDPEALHAEGMVFEPTGSLTEAHEAAQTGWVARSRSQSGLDRIAQVFLRFLREALALVYYPLWVGRYSYRNRTYQVVVDGQSGKVLYGKAPGNIFFRALMLVGGTAIGSFVLVDGMALALAFVANSNDDDNLAALLVPLVAGVALIYGGYRLFRWGEEIEHKEKA
jgi:DNA-directed RNA polymerase subunit RPC12/RpoP